MGGKTKQSQRTKNNARPSSSGRSAELLSSVKPDSGLVNIAGTQLPALFPSLIAPTVDPLISPELQLCLKKLNKKDPITKTKALQELTELVANSKVDDVVSALPSWAHFYRILTADPDRKVREWTQACHGAIVGVCGRRVAPRLRALLPAWLQAQHDDHAPAMAHANNSLKKTFPDHKLPEALSFCREEVMAHLLDALAANGEAAYIRKTDSPEEQAARVLSCSLHGLQYAVRHLPPAHDAWLWPQLDALLQPQAFWKRASHVEPRIRAAWCGALGSVAARFPSQLGAAHGARALRTLLGAAERDPLAAAQLWDCLLLFMHNVPDWHQYLEKKELLSKRILDVLESGGWGDARHLCDMLLPMLASLPDEILTKEFHIKFFDAIFSGLDQKSILNSKSERQAWITSLDECLRYLSTTERAFALEVATAVHRAWLEKVLGLPEGPARTHLVRVSAQRMAGLIRYWLRQAERGAPRYDQLVRNSWQNIGSTLAAQLDRLPPGQPDLVKDIEEVHILLIQSLRSSSQEARKQNSIKFEMDATEEEPSPGASQPVEPSVALRYIHNLEEVTRGLCCKYLEWAGARQESQAALSALVALLGSVEGAAVWEDAARRFGCPSPRALYERVLRGWLAGDAMRSRALVQLCFMLLARLQPEDQDAVFDSFKQFPPSVVEWCMALALSHPYCGLASARRWLRGALAAGAARALCARVLRAADSRDRSLLLMCLDTDAHGESVLSPAAVEGALQAVAAALDAPDAALEQRAQLAAQLAATHAPHPALLTALLRTTLTVQRGSPALSLETWCEVRDAWQEGVAALEPEARRTFLLDAVAMLHAHLNLCSSSAVDPTTQSSDETADPNTSTRQPASDKNDLTTQSSDETADLNTSTKPASDKNDDVELSKIEHVVSLCPALAGYESSAAELRAFTSALLFVPATPPLALEAHAVRHYILMGNLNCPFEDTDVMRAISSDTLAELTKQDLITHMNTCLFRTTYMRTVLLHRADDEAADSRCDELLADEYFQGEFVECVHAYTVLSALHEGYAFWPHYKLMDKSKNRLETLLDDIIKETSKENRKQILNLLKKTAKENGYFWIYSTAYYENKINELSSDQASSPSEVENISARGTGKDEDVETENSKTDEDLTSSETNKNKDVTIDKDLEERTKEIREMLKDCYSNRSDGHALVNVMNFLQCRAKRGGSAAAAARYKWFCALGSLRVAARRSRAAAEALGEHAADASPAAATPDVFINTYYAHRDTMLFEKNVSDAPWAHVANNADIADYLAHRVRAQGWMELPHAWDFINIALCSLLSSANLSREHWGTTKVALLTRSALRLFVAVATFVTQVPVLSRRAEPLAHVAELPDEWCDIYAADLNFNLFSLALYIVESHTGEVTSCHVAVIDALIACTPLMCWDGIGAQHIAAGGALAPERLVRGAAAALQRVQPPAIKYLAHDLLRAMIRPLVMLDAEEVAARGAAAEAAGEAEAGAALELSLQYYAPCMARLQDLTDTLLASYQECESLCRLEAHSDAHSIALGYLLLADMLNNQCALARADLTHHYIQIYRHEKYAEPLLRCALRLLPPGVLAASAGAGAAGAGGARAPPPPRHVEHFTEPPATDVYKWCGGGATCRLACRAVYWSVRGPGAVAARGWRGAAHHAHAQMLDNITARFITPTVVKEEFALLQNNASTLEDTEVTINRAAYSVSCVLTVEDRPVALTVELARAHPLVLPRLAAPHAAAGNVNWILMYLGYQNGTIFNALRMWCASVNSKVERAPQCYICYCRLHHATGRLPKVFCHTCRNKFHQPCLRKWFQSSSKMTCPLCRATF